MSEREAVDRTVSPVTPAAIRDGLEQLGLPLGATVLVHASLSALGWVAGGAHAVVLALVDTVGPSGTLVMPTQSSNLSDPAHWSNPPVPEGWWELIRRETPAFDPSLTPTRHMGAIVECFRHLPGVRRSDHPTRSFAAAGPAADGIVGSHEPTHGFGERSPLARLYDADAWVLLLGVGHANNTSLHLAEYRANYPGKAWTQQGSPLMIDGRHQWIEYSELVDDYSDFEALGEAFAQTGSELQARIGAGTVRLMRQRALVDFAVQWFEDHRQPTPSRDS
ncbi:MAG: AAC(3) family N-acetyltransferase [Candidatus Dormibacteraeota bacterium]|uniref:Aminoglycoside N(3)-acetyltransferase n=1 Tax=Candidatus Amunia macphersoniae TaxID=3127014 RepID=A0A934NAE4_9BACT|nr:AAC(3) family N-acetyltransferase [Candidatus Dormibacteraeota bacterium]